jgi:hypothetical protein
MCRITSIVLRSRRQTVAETHPVQVLQAALETQRQRAVENLARKVHPLSLESLREVAILQVVLTAVREEIELHSFRPGWGEDQK